VDKPTARGVYDNGELRLVTPVAVTGCWRVEITFVEQLADAETPFEADPHRPAARPLPDQIEEFHRYVGDQAPHIGPF
jgi:hypothetical protein